MFLSILGISWFWLYGALFLAQFPVYAKNVLGGNETSVTLLLATFTVGIGLGSMLCEKLSGQHVEIGLVPFGSIGLTLFGLDLVSVSYTHLDVYKRQPSLNTGRFTTWRLPFKAPGIRRAGYNSTVCRSAMSRVS